MLPYTTAQQRVSELEQAAQDQDLTAVANLGQEYQDTEAELEQTLEKWGG